MGAKKGQFFLSSKIQAAVGHAPSGNVEKSFDQYLIEGFAGENLQEPEKLARLKKIREKGR